MGARPSSFKKGGGFLNGVDGVITGYEFTDELPNGDPFKPGKDPKTGKPRFHSLFFKLFVRVDGADEDVNTHLFAGGADDFEITDDGKTLEPTEEGRELGANTAFARYITSLVQAGFPEVRLPEDAINYESIIGTRVRLVQRKNEEDTRKLGKRKDQKTGKEYDRTDLVVDQVYSLPDDGTSPAKPAAKGAAKPAAKGKQAPAAPAEPEGDAVKDLASATLIDILSDNDGKIQKSKLSMKVLTKLMKNPQREDVRKYLFDDSNLEAFAEEGIISFNKAKGLIEAA